MKSLSDRQEIAEALNFGKYPVLKIDLSTVDDYGLRGDICRIDMGEFRDGSKYYEKAELRVYSDENKITFSSFGCCLSADKSYFDFMDDVKTAQAPILKPDSEFVVIVHDSCKCECYAVYIVKTGKVSRHCLTPISVEPVDMSTFLVMAEARYKK